MTVLFTAMKRRHKQKSRKNREIALSRITALFATAAEEFHRDQALSTKYALLAQRIAMKCKCKIPARFRRLVCRHCHTYLVPGANCRVRMTGKTVSYFCMSCRSFSRYGYQRRATGSTNQA